MNILFIKHFCVGFMVSEIPKMFVSSTYTCLHIKFKYKNNILLITKAF